MLCESGISAELENGWQLQATKTRDILHSTCSENGDFQHHSCIHCAVTKTSFLKKKIASTVCNFQVQSLMAGSGGGRSGGDSAAGGGGSRGEIAAGGGSRLENVIDNLCVATLKCCLIIHT